MILGAVGLLQVDVVAWRLRNEYGVSCTFEGVSVAAARWVNCEDTAQLAKFKDNMSANLAMDGDDRLAYLAPSRVNLNLTGERRPEIAFLAAREH